MLVIDEHLSLRRATSSDIHNLYSWKNDPASRASAIESRDPIPWETHVAWLESTLEREDVELYIILFDGTPVGSWRFDLYENRIECSLLVDPAYRRFHIGSKVFSFGTEYIQVRTNLPVICKVVEGNIPPMRYHIHAGFLPFEYHQDGGYYLWRRDVKRIEPEH